MVGRRAARSGADAVEGVGFEGWVLCLMGLAVVLGGSVVVCCWVVELEVELGFLVVPVYAGMATMPGSRSRSSWKCTRAATSSLENSRGPWVPARMGAVKRGHSAVQAWRRAGRVREADRARAS